MRIPHCTVALILTASVALAAPVSAQAPAAGAAQPSADFQVFFRGIPIGSEQVSVVRTPEGTTISGSARLGAPINVTVRRAEIKYSPAGNPLSCSVEGSSQDRLLSIIMSVNNGVATTDLTQGTENSRKADQIAADAVLLLNGFFGSYEGLALRLSAANVGDQLRAYVPAQGQLSVRFRGSAQERLRAPSGAIDARRLSIQLENPGAPLDAEIWVNGEGRMLRLSVPAQSFEMVRADIASVATRREPVSRPNDEQVRIQGNGFSLAGTLSRPTGAVASGQRLPAIVLVGGAGTADRDEAIAGLPLFGQLASSLADAGYMVIRYDKRGVGQSGGRWETAGVSDYAEDVKAVVQFLRKRKDVDGKRIALLGHGEGGFVAMLAASRDDNVKALVLVATPGVSGADLVLEQQQHALASMKITDEERRARIERQQQIHKAVLTGEGWDNIPPTMRRQADTAWFRSFLSFDPAAIMRRVDQPVLIVQGELDKQVAPANADKLAEHARARKPSPKRTTQLAKVPGINHLLVEAKTGEVDEYAGLSDKKISETVVTPIVSWLKDAFASR